MKPAVVVWLAKASVSHSVDSDLRRSVDGIPLGETIPAMNMFYSYMLLKPIRTHNPEQNPP